VSEKITLDLEDATDHQLRVALEDAESMARACDSQHGLLLHTWHQRAEVIRAEIQRRNAAAPDTEGEEGWRG
jgi:hypothetical protein